MKLQMLCTCVDVDTGEQIGQPVVVCEFTSLEQLARVNKQLHIVLSWLKPHAING